MYHFLESSAEELYQSSVKAFPNTTMRQHATQPIVIKELRWTPFVGVNTLFIKSIAQNENREYSPCILCKGVDYKGNQVKITANDGRQYNFNKLSLENTDILVRCNCGDFFWRGNYADHLDGSLYGRKRRKYESNGGPPANPTNAPMICKHLMKMIKVVNEAGIFNDV
jgi:hypothetical protein